MLGTHPRGPRLTSCNDVHAPSVFSGFGMTTVINVPMNGDFDPSKSTAVIAPGDTVYASVDSLYVATTRWVESEATTRPPGSTPGGSAE